MSLPFSVCVIWSAAAAAIGLQPAVPSSPESSVHRIVAAAATPVLPAELHAFFDRHIDNIVATAAGAASEATPVVGAEDAVVARSIERAFAGLGEAFRSSDVSAIEGASGRLLHLAADSALRFRAARDAGTAQPGNLSWAEQGAPESVRSDRTLALRVELGAMAMLDARLAYEVRVAPARYVPVSVPHDAAMQFVGDTNAALPLLARVDAEAMRALGIADAEGFASSRDDYYERFARRAAPILENRLEAAVLLYANLVGTAWENAGRPELGTDHAEATPVVHVPRADATQPGHVGSRHSQVFHKPTCPHARRIKPENLVQLGTATAAKKAGRTPCRTCKPD